jgi:hypothetical protein
VQKVYADHYQSRMRQFRFLIVFLAALFLQFSRVFSQHLIMAAQTEYTVSGYQHGGAMAYETKKLWAAGAFYQTQFMTVKEGYRHYLYGGYFQFPIVRSDKISLLGTLRGGMANSKFVVIIPGLETRITLRKRFSLGLGMSLRINYPSLSLRLIFRIL